MSAATADPTQATSAGAARTEAVCFIVRLNVRRTSARRLSRRRARSILMPQVEPRAMEGKSAAKGVSVEGLPVAQLSVSPFTDGQHSRRSVVLPAQFLHHPHHLQ